MRFTELPQSIQARAMDLFTTTYGLDLEAAVAQAYAQTDPRTVRAEAYLGKYGSQFRQTANGVLVPSESQPGRWYVVSDLHCSCPDGGRHCKHIPAVALWNAKRDTRKVA